MQIVTRDQRRKACLERVQKDAKDIVGETDESVKRNSFCVEAGHIMLYILSAQNQGLNTQNKGYMGHSFGYFGGPGLQNLYKKIWGMQLHPQK